MSTGNVILSLNPILDLPGTPLSSTLCPVTRQLTLYEPMGATENPSSKAGLKIICVEKMSDETESNASDCDYEIELHLKLNLHQLSSKALVRRKCQKLPYMRPQKEMKKMTELKSFSLDYDE